MKYFANSDLEWVKLIVCLRSVDMSIGEIKNYIALCMKGFETARNRREMLGSKKQELLQKIQKLKESLSHLDYKIDFYDEMLKNKQDGLNPLGSKIPKNCKNS